MIDIIDKPGNHPHNGPGESSSNRLLGFDGISFFKEIDDRYITIDTKPRSELGSQTVQFDKNSGNLYFIETDTTGPNARSGIGFNLRTGEYLSIQEKQDPKEDPRILKALELLGHQYDSWLDEPPGYPEVEEFCKKITTQIPINLSDNTNIISKGDYLLFYDSLSRLHACKISEAQAINDMPIAKGGYRILTDAQDPSIDISTYDFHPEQEVHDTNQVVGAVAPIESEFILDKERQGLWKISEQEYKLLMQYAEIRRDPSIEYPLSREEYVIASALDGMAFERWGASIESIRSKDPERYSTITEENLQKAVKNLILRFGEPAFTNAVLFNTLQHVYRLHTPKHRTEVIGAQNNAFGDVHSDILGFKRDVSRLVKDIIKDTHPVVTDMEKDGCGRVGLGVYNVKSIFGDMDMLEILKLNYPDTFNQLVKFLIELSPINQGSWYGDSTVFPLRAIKEYFRQAFDYMEKNYNADMPNVEGPGIEFKENK